VDSAAELGLELFYVDAGWYEGSPSEGDFSWGLGSWRENRDKFPSGLAAFSEYVHSKGMKFGLWVEPERVDLRYVGPDMEISRDWLAPSTAFDQPPPWGSPQYAQVCLGNAEARAWMKQWLARLVRDYQLDWLKWDNNVWVTCDSPGEPGRGNYAHVVGLYEVLDYLHEQFPQLVVEDCASGGHRMDYGLIRRTDIAWLSDQTEPSYRVRHHVYGASYPFPPEYLNTWIVESYFEHLADVANDPPHLRAWIESRMMGAFGISVSTVDWSAAIRDQVAEEIKTYKSIRDIISHGNLYHLSPQPDLTEPPVEPSIQPDAMEYYDPVTKRGAVFLFGGTEAWDYCRFRLRGLDPSTTYHLTSSNGSLSLFGSGTELMSHGIALTCIEDRPSTLLLLDPADSQH
jgi:alpha-galactosidase